MHVVGRHLSQQSIAYHCYWAWSEKVPTIMQVKNTDTFLLLYSKSYLQTLTYMVPNKHATIVGMPLHIKAG